MSWDGLIVSLGILAFFALMVFATTPGALSRAADRMLRTFFSYRDIFKPEGLYLRRFFITPRRWLGYDYFRGRSRWPRVLGWVPTKYRKIFVHHILLSDDRVPHDHPWDFTTRIIAGEYVETIGRRGRDQRRGTAGSVFKNGAGHIHFLEVVEPVWSLMLAGESRRVWGFWGMDSDGAMRWQDWRTYLRCPFAPTEPEDQIDPERFPGGAAADAAFMINDAIRGNRLQPTASAARALDAHRVMVKSLGSTHDHALEYGAPTTWLNLGTMVHEMVAKQYAPAPAEEPTPGFCVTTPDGGCIGSGCVHDVVPTTIDDEATTRKIVAPEPLTDEEEARLWDATLMDGLDKEET